MYILLIKIGVALKIYMEELFRDNLGRFDIESEVNFGKVTAVREHYLVNTPALKNKGGCYVTSIFSNTTGEQIIRKHYKSDYARSRNLSKLIDECEEQI